MVAMNNVGESFHVSCEPGLVATAQMLSMNSVTLYIVSNFVRMDVRWPPSSILFEMVQRVGHLCPN